MPASRLLPDQQAVDLVAMAREFSQTKLATVAQQMEMAAEFPKQLLLEAAELGFMRLSYPVAIGGGGYSYEVALQALEELASGFMAFAVAASVHTMTCWAMSQHATDDQKKRLWPAMIQGRLLGGYALSERNAGSDVSAIATTAELVADEWVINGEKMWIGPHHQGDYFIVFARTGQARSNISAFYVPAQTSGVNFSPTLNKLAMHVTPLGAITFDQVRIPATNLIGVKNKGMQYALAGLDRGRLSIAAIAIGVAQAALDYATAYCNQRKQFGQQLAEFQGMQFMLADMEATISAGRAAYLLAARKLDAGVDFSRDAAIAKLVCTDGAMKVCTDAVQVLGGQGVNCDHPVERYFREAKITQIFEGTNQIQRLVIARSLLKTMAKG